MVRGFDSNLDREVGKDKTVGRVLMSFADKRPIVEVFFLHLAAVLGLRCLGIRKPPIFFEPLKSIPARGFRLVPARLCGDRHVFCIWTLRE